MALVFAGPRHPPCIRRARAARPRKRFTRVSVSSQECHWVHVPAVPKPSEASRGARLNGWETPRAGRSEKRPRRFDHGAGPDAGQAGTLGTWVTGTRAHPAVRREKRDTQPHTPPNHTPHQHRRNVGVECTSGKQVWVGSFAKEISLKTIARARASTSSAVRTVKTPRDLPSKHLVTDVSFSFNHSYLFQNLPGASRRHGRR